MSDQSVHYLSPKLEARTQPAKGKNGIFARQPVAPGELLVVWGGQVLDEARLEQLSPCLRSHSIQVEEGLYLASFVEDEEADFFNHSGEPNAWLSGQISLTAIRAIAAGEEVCFDYATCDGSPYDEFKCECGTPGCRGRITGEDWRNPELWERYAGHFSPYLQRRIDRLKAGLAGGK